MYVTRCKHCGSYMQPTIVYDFSGSPYIKMVCISCNNEYIPELIYHVTDRTCINENIVRSTHCTTTSTVYELNMYK